MPAATGWMAQNLSNYSSIGATARCNPVLIRGIRPPELEPPPSPWALKLMLPPAKPRMTHACSSRGWMVQNLSNYSSIGANARCNPVLIRS